MGIFSVDVWGDPSGAEGVLKEEEQRTRGTTMA